MQAPPLRFEDVIDEEPQQQPNNISENNNHYNVFQGGQQNLPIPLPKPSQDVNQFNEDDPLNFILE